MIGVVSALFLTMDKYHARKPLVQPHWRGHWARCANLRYTEVVQCDPEELPWGSGS